MKDGKLVESGTHRALIETKGEYFNLYNIQAQAFAEVCSFMFTALRMRSANRFRVRTSKAKPAV